MRAREQGFTLFEMLAVMLILGLVIAVVPMAAKSPSPMAKAKSDAATIAARLRGLRSAAIVTSGQRMAVIDMAKRQVRFDDGRAPVAIDRSLSLTVTSADSERSANDVRGVRFYPNGGSSGATITIASGKDGYRIRVNWLTGRVSTDAL